MERYKDTYVGRPSALAQALDRKDSKEAEKVYKETTANYNRLYPKEDRKWFSSHQRKSLKD